VTRPRGALAVTLALVATTVVVATGAQATGDKLASDDARCQWPTWGYSAARPFATPCDTGITEDSVDELRLRWFFNARDVVTVTPALAGNTLYVGDWSGRFYALRTRDGRPRWTFDAEVHPTVYAGQIVGTATVARVSGVQTVFFPAGKTMYALRARDGKVLWRHEMGRAGDPDDPTEIESSPAVVRDLVLFGTDVHNSGNGEAAGLVALDARTGKERWMLVTAPTAGDGATGSGCGDVWGSPAVDRARGLVFFGTGNCPDPAKWGRFSDAIVAADLETGTLRWTYQPHEQNNDDLDFAGAPNLIDAGGRALVGLGNKDGTYYLVDRETGEPAGAIRATGPGLRRPGSNFSTGGFIGPTAYDRGAQLVVGGTAVGPAPYLHGLDVDKATVAWQSQEPSATYAPTAITDGLAFVGGTDFTLRAVRVIDGETLWSHPMKGAVSGGVALTRGSAFAVAGIREPGLDQRSRSSGVYRFSLTGKRATIKIAAPETTTTTVVGATASQECVGSPCTMSFDLKTPPNGRSPSVTLEVDEAPFEVAITAAGLGPPDAWLRPGTPAARAGATAYAVFLSERDDNPTGGLVCILRERDGGTLGCTGRRIPRKGATYNRITLVAVKDADSIPTLADGFERLVTTESFSPPLAPER